MAAAGGAPPGPPMQPVQPPLPSPLQVFVPYNPRVASTRVRVHHWLQRTGIPAQVHDWAALGNHGVGTLARHPVGVARAELQLRRRESHGSFDRVLVQRQVSPFSGGPLERRILTAAGLGVYDFDDALMTMPRAGVQRLWPKAEACRAGVTYADRVLAGSEYLAGWAQDYCTDVRLIPTCVEVGDYRGKTDYDLADPPRLVWLGSPATEHHLRHVAAAVARANEAFGARLAVISAGDRDLGPLTPFVDRVQWYPGVESTLADYDLGLAPLLDEPLARGKCAYKMLQYGAAGLPVVATPLGANAQVGAELGVAFADGVEAWTDAVMGLLSAGAAERAAVGTKARGQTQRSYSYDAWQDAWLAAVGEVD